MRPNFSYKLNRPILFLTLILLLTAYSLQLNATIRYVSKTGLSIPPYTTLETAADSIQKCINICVFGDTIYVANGVYEEQVVMIPGLALIGSGSDSTVINTQALVNSNGFIAVEVKDSCLFKGFNIVVYTNSDKGYGIAQSGNSLVTENRITTAAYGMYVGYTGTNIPVVYKNTINNVNIGIDIFNSSLLIRKNIIYAGPNPQAVTITGVRIGAFTDNYSPILDSNYIVTNGDAIYKNLGSRPVIQDNIMNLINGNGIIIQQSDTAKVFNNLILNSGYSGIDNNSFTNLPLINNFVKGVFGTYGIKVGPNTFVENNVVTNKNRGIGKWGSQNPVVQYNDSWNNNLNYDEITPDSTNLSVNPMVVNDDTTQGKLDFHLQMFSPLIDAGDPNILDKDSTRSDIGLYGGPYGESYIYVDLPPRPPVNLTVVVDTLIKLKWNRNTEADFSHYNLYRDTTANFQIDSTKLVASLTDTFYNHIIPTGVESLYFKLTAVDNQGNESNPSEEIAVILVSIKNEWKPVNNYILYQNYPNPFNPTTKIGYKLKERGYVKLYVYDIKGEMVSVLVNEVQESGYYEVEFNAVVGHSGSILNLASGVYIYQIFVSNDNRIPVFSDIKKMVYVK